MKIQEEVVVKIRTYQPGDEVVQAAVYNEAAAGLPKFKPAAEDEVRRRCRAADFDSSARFYAEENGQVIGYATFHANGRVSYPWCRKYGEHAAEPLFQRVLQTMTDRGMSLAFAAYRADWTEQRAFFELHGFQLAREMTNFVMDLADMPTRVPLPAAVTPLCPEDVPAILAMAPQALRARTADELDRHLFHNPYFEPSAVFVLRDSAGAPTAVGILVDNPAYADPTAIDPAMPCFRLGAFGTEGMQTKRVNGLFSVLAPSGPDLLAHASALMEHAALWLEKEDLSTVAAQVPSDAPHLLRFYQGRFRRQGSFPVYEKALR